MHSNCIEMYLILKVMVFHAFQNCVDGSLPDNTMNDTLYLRVKSGRTIDAGAVPYQVSLYKLRTVLFDSGRYQYVCGGAILATNKVLTAAHCVYRRRTLIERWRCLPVSQQKMVTKNMYVVAGNFPASMQYPAAGSAEQWRRIKDTVAPHDYSFPRRDISLVFLKKPFIYNAFIKNIFYPSTFKEYNWGSTFKCMVYGHGGEGLKVKKVTVMTNEECSNKHSKNMIRFLCPVMEDDDMETGDAGGGLVCADTGHTVDAKGIVLVGIGCAVARGGPLYTRVSAYAEFINNNTAATTAGPNFAVFYIHLFISYF